MQPHALESAHVVVRPLRCASSGCLDVEQGLRKWWFAVSNQGSVQMTKLVMFMSDDIFSDCGICQLKQRERR